MKKIILTLGILSLLLCGCSMGEETQQVEKLEYPVYFQPAVTELKTSLAKWNREGSDPFSEVFEPAFRDFGLSCVGSEHDGIFRCCKGGACWLFDLSENEQYIGGEGEGEIWDWFPVAIYHVEEQDRVYISWSRIGEHPSEYAPQFLLLSFPAGKPWEREAKFFQKPSLYADQGFWGPNCCLVGDDFYFMDGSDTVAFNMQTGELHDLYPKLNVVRRCANRFRGDTDCSMYNVGFLYEQDGVEVYCAYVSDEMEGYVFVAFQDGEPIAGMRADVSGEDLRIEMIEVDESGGN